MGQTIGTSQKGSVNIELNIVPFIDLMSCLTAFLLVTAVWVNLSSLENEPAGKAGTIEEAEKPRLAILLEHDQILVQQMPSGEARQIAAFDWAKLEDALKDFRPADASWPEVEIAASSTSGHPIEYQQLIAAMDTAVKVGYPRVGITEPSSLSITLPH